MFGIPKDIRKEMVQQYPWYTLPIVIALTVVVVHLLEDIQQKRNTNSRMRTVGEMLNE